MSPHVRPAVLDEVDTLSLLTGTIIRAQYRAFLGDEAVEEFLKNGDIQRYFRDAIPRCRVIQVGQRIAGVAVHQKAMIDLLMIDHRLQRRGLGTALLRHMEEQLFRRHQRLTLESFEPNEQANRFYLKNGWVELRKYADADSGVNKIVFGKTRRASA